MLPNYPVYISTSIQLLASKAADIDMRYFVLLLGLLLQLAAFLLFCKGFFPTKVLLTPAEVELFSTPYPNIYIDPAPQFNKVVLMVVDAMRADFLFSNNSRMSFAHSLLNDGYGVGFTAFSNPPTVTLPRLKGITTGSTPNFIDAVLNIADDDTTSSLGDSDSWIRQMFLENWNINMFGDDTWLKLFPDYFAKTEGTASFYVSDFTIVDNNVTRHLEYELSEDGKSHWDCLILHYLGLDHIGHKGGPSSSNMPHKQEEMDSILERIFNEVILQDPNSLFIVLGDHGMNDVGNHGGSSTAETSAALMMISQKFKGLNLNGDTRAPVSWNDRYDYFSRIDQIDLVPTLTELIGLKVPINNLGVFIPQFLELYSNEEQKKNVLLKNALQLKVLLDKSHGEVQTFPDMNNSELLQFINNAKEELSRSSSDYDYPFIYAGLVLFLLETLVSFVFFAFHFKNHFHVAFFDVVFFITYSANFIASSMVEEEHHLWWFFTTVYTAFIILKKLRGGKISWLGILTMLVGLRLLKAWNNSGQKHNSKANMKLSTYLSQLPENIGPNIYASLLIISILPMAIIVNVFNEIGIYTIVLNVLFSILSFLNCMIKMISFLTENCDIIKTSLNPKWYFTLICNLKEVLQLDDYNKINNILFVLLHRFWLMAMLLQLFQPLYAKFVKRKSTPSKSYLLNLLSIVTFILISQTNYLNVPIFPLLYLILFGLVQISPESSINSNAFNLFTLLLQNLTFFQFGSTNSLSSVDLTNSFNGLTSYNVFLSGLLTYTCNWAGPIFWTIAHLYIVTSKIPEDRIRSIKWNLLFDRLLFNFVFYSTSSLLLLSCCYLLRFHLFIWTVFSPKILYFLSWLVCNFIFDFLVSAGVVAFFV